MSTLATVIGLALALLPFVIGYVARSKGRSALTWSLLSVVLTPFGSLNSSSDVAGTGWWRG